MTCAPVLKLPVFLKVFVIQNNNSGKGMGAVLHQDRHSISFYNKKLCVKSTYENYMPLLQQFTNGVINY